MNFAPAAQGPEVRMRLQADLNELRRLAVWIQDIGRSAGLAANELFALQLCVEEAVANIIMYGGLKRADEAITVDVSCDARQVIAVIEDNGQPFDPTQVPAPQKSKTLDHAKLGDVGVHLMRSFASDMSYELCEGRNRLTLVFARPEPASKESA